MSVPGERQPASRVDGGHGAERRCGAPVRAAAALVLAAMLHGCASLSEEECLSADWAVMGESDGQRGRPLSDFNRYRRDCAEYGVAPDTEAYMAGRERGLVLYCTEDNGYREGRGGASAEPVCPIDLEPAFRLGYELGRGVYDSLSDLHDTNDTIDSARREIDDLRRRIADHESSSLRADIGEDEKRSLHDEIHSMEERIDGLEREVAVGIGTLAVAITRYQQAVAAARRAGYDEPMETELLSTLGRLVR